jgi:hypothetical protein
MGSTCSKAAGQRVRTRFRGAGSQAGRKRVSLFTVGEASPGWHTTATMKRREQADTMTAHRRKRVRKADGKKPTSSTVRRFRAQNVQSNSPHYRLASANRGKCTVKTVASALAVLRVHRKPLHRTRNKGRGARSIARGIWPHAVQNHATPQRCPDAPPVIQNWKARSETKRHKSRAQGGTPAQPDAQLPVKLPRWQIASKVRQNPR